MEDTREFIELKKNIVMFFSLGYLDTFLYQFGTLTRRFYKIITIRTIQTRFP